MEPFASEAQYVARFGAVEDVGVLEECLLDASAAIRMALDKARIDYSNPSDDLSYRLMSTCRSVANRIMPRDTDTPAGVTQRSQTAGSYNETISYTPIYSTPKLLPSELSMLGLGGTGRMLHPTCTYGREAADDLWH